MSENKNAPINKDNTGDNSAKRLEGVAMGIHHFGGPVEEAGNYRQTWSKLFAYARAYMPKVILAIVLTVIANLCQVSAPGRLRTIVDVIRLGLSGPVDTEALRNTVVFLGCLYACAALMNFLQNYTMAAVTARLSKSLRIAITEKINRLPLKYFDRVSIGDVISRVTNDVDTVGSALNQNIGMLISASTQFAGSLFLMLYTNLTLAATAICASAIGFIASKIVTSHSSKYFRGQQQGLGAVNGFVEEVFSGHHVVMAFNGGEEALRSFGRVNDSLYQAAWKANFVSGFITPLMNFSGSIAYVAICVVGAMLVMGEQISFGVIVAFLMYVDQFTQGITHIAETVPGFQGATAASERVFELLDEAELEDESGKTARLTDVKGNVAFQNLNFGYHEDHTIIHDFSIDVQAGQKIAIVGPTGAGKTTIVNLLMRFYELGGGEIRIDGTPVSQVTREDVRSQFSMVLQDAWLFEGTLRDNIVYNKSGVTDQQVEDVCKAVGLHRFVSALPMG
ncbi:MAG: ABC transporter ATP-binding protein/permease, partial [Clostridiales bacterium]|nr:ABC transporter ATP-binding protein/permease [Clostridiales bacterium]